MGKLPDGWHRVRLDTLAHIQTGIAKGGKSISNPVQLPYLRVANVQDGYLDLSEIKLIEVDRSTANRYLLQVGDILLTEGGDFDKLGRGAVWQGEVPNCLHQNHVFAVRVDQDVILPDFFAMQSASPYGKQYFLSCAKRTTNLASINKTQLSEFPVLLPPLAEQRKIAEILSTWDEAIALVEALIAALKRRKQGLMQRLLTGEVRFPGFEDAWQEVRLGEIGRCIRGVSYKPDTDLRPHDQQGTVRLLRANNIYAERIDRDSIQFVTRESVKTSQFLEDGDIAICMASGSKEIVGKAAIFDIDDEFDYTVGAFCAIFRTYNSNDKLYASSLFHSEIYRRQLRSAYAGSSINNLKPSDIEGLVFQVPEDHTERKAITEMLYDANSEIDDWVTLLDGFREQKRGLMQRLLTGEVRVRV